MPLEGCGSAMAGANDAELQAGQRIGAFEVTMQLSKRRTESSGKVFRGQQTARSSKVDLKVSDYSVDCEVTQVRCRGAEDPEHGRFLLRELQLLSLCREHANIVSLEDVFVMPGPAEFRSICIVTTALATDLRAVICSQAGILQDHMQWFAYGILNGLRYIHAANMVHGNLSPASVMIGRNDEVQLCDFGRPRAHEHVRRWWMEQEERCVAFCMLSQRRYA